MHSCTCHTILPNRKCLSQTKVKSLVQHWISSWSRWCWNRNRLCSVNPVSRRPTKSLLQPLTSLLLLLLSRAILHPRIWWHVSLSHPSTSPRRSWHLSSSDSFVSSCTRVQRKPCHPSLLHTWTRLCRCACCCRSSGLPLEAEFILDLFRTYRPVHRQQFGRSTQELRYHARAQNPKTNPKNQQPRLRQLQVPLATTKHLSPNAAVLRFLS